MEFDLSQTDTLLSTTRAVRKRLDLTRPVPREVVMECIALSMQAPTGSNSQGWRWVVVDDEGKLLGLISIGDLVKDIISGQKFVIEQLEHYITGQRG